MNCLEFRRAAAIDPSALDGPAAHHLSQCDGCREFRARALAFEQRLEAALRIPVPADLTEKLIARASHKPRHVSWYALSAGVLLALAAGAGLLLTRDDALALAGIDFVVYEEAQAIVDAKPPDPHVLDRVAGEMSISLPDRLGDIRYICFYPFGPGGAHHLLVKTPLGKVTLLLIPRQRLAARVVAAAHGLEAAVAPLDDGAVAIIAESARSIARVEALLKSI